MEIVNGSRQRKARATIPTGSPLTRGATQAPMIAQNSSTATLGVRVLGSVARLLFVTVIHHAKAAGYAAIALTYMTFTAAYAATQPPEPPAPAPFRVCSVLQGHIVCDGRVWQVAQEKKRATKARKPKVDQVVIPQRQCDQIEAGDTPCWYPPPSDDPQ